MIYLKTALYIYRSYDNGLILSVHVPGPVLTFGFDKLSSLFHCVSSIFSLMNPSTTPGRLENESLKFFRVAHQVII